MKLIKKAQFGTALQKDNSVQVQNPFLDFNEMATVYKTAGSGGGDSHWVDRAYNDTKGIPYLWGGKWRGSTKPKGIDCSGLVCYLAKNYAGINIPETNAQGIYSKLKRNYNNVIQQNWQRKPFDQRTLRKGDIIYFGDKKGDHTNHIGIIHSIRNDGKALMLNASGLHNKVVISPIDEYLADHKYAAITRLR